MRNQLLTASLLAATLLSCKKDENRSACTEHCVTLSGQVTDTPGGQPVNNALVQLTTGTGALAQARTGADGRYSLTVSYPFSAPGPAVTLRTSHPDYLSNEIGTDAIKYFSPSGDTATENVHLYRTANLQVHLTAPGYGNGAVVIHDIRFGAPGPFLPSFPMTSYMSASNPLDTTFTQKTAADVPVSVEFSAAGHRFRDTVTLPAGTTRLLQVPL